MRALDGVGAGATGRAVPLGLGGSAAADALDALATGALALALDAASALGAGGATGAELDAGASARCGAAASSVRAGAGASGAPPVAVGARA